MKELSTLVKECGMNAVEGEHGLTATAKNGQGFRYAADGTITLLNGGKDVARITTAGGQWTITSPGKTVTACSKAEVQSVVNSLMS